MKHILTLLAVLISALTLTAQTSQEDKKGPVPVKHWEFDYVGYQISAGQQTVYLTLAPEVRYNFDDSPWDIGGSFIMGASPHAHVNFSELRKGDVVKNVFFMMGPVAHYNFRRGRNFSFYLGCGLGAGLGILETFESCYTTENGDIIENWDENKHFAAALTPRMGVEAFRHFRVGLLLRIPTSGEVTFGPTISYTFGGGKKKQ